jgi:outer membrane cobalamin receptor
MNFTKKSLYLVFLCLGHIIANRTMAQKAVVIKGSVADSNQNKAITYATVGLFKSSNLDKAIKNVFTNAKGFFEFTKADTGSYIVIVSHAGFAEKRSSVIAVKSNKDTINLGSLMLGQAIQGLKEVVVTARKPLIEQTDEKLVYNTEADPSVEGLTAIDLLRKTPFVSVDGDGNIQLNGQTNFKVLLNGKETAMFSKNLKEALQSFPANLIKRVEVITSPSSKYDAEGIGGIINIITKKKIMGYNGSIGINHNTIGNTGGNASLSAKYGKLGFSGYYGIGGVVNQWSRNTSETESFDPIAFYKRLSSGNNTNNYTFQYGNAELSLDIDSLNTISTYANLNGGNNKSDQARNFSVIAANKIDTSNSVYLNNNHYDYPSFSWGSDYIRKFAGKPDKELSYKMYFERSHDDSYETSDQYNTPFDTRYVINNNTTLNRQATFQADYVQPLKNNSKIEAGAKVIMRMADADYESLSRYDLNEKFNLDSSNSDNFNYHQGVYSLYFTYRFNWKKLSFRLGARVEGTTIDGDFMKTTAKVSQDYTNLIPNIYISKKLDKTTTLSFSYTDRLRRPYIWDLNPFVSNTDSLNISYGNPNLRAELYHTLELGLVFIKGKTNINIRLNESISNNQIAYYSEFNNVTGVTTRTDDNIGSYSATSLSGNISGNINPKWRYNTFMNLQYSFIKNRLDPSQKNSGFGGNINVSSNYDFTQKFTSSLFMGLFRPNVMIQGTSGLRYFYSLGGTYKFFNKKLVLGFNAVNFLESERSFKNDIQDANFHTVSWNYFPGRNCNVSLRWNFGKLTENVSRKRGVNNDDLKGNSN